MGRPLEDCIELSCYHWFIIFISAGSSYKAFYHTRKQLERPNYGLLRKNSIHYSLWIYCLLLISNLNSFSSLTFLTLFSLIFIVFLLVSWFFQYTSCSYNGCICMLKRVVYQVTTSYKNTFRSGTWHLGLLHSSSSLDTPRLINTQTHTHTVWILF